MHHYHLYLLMLSGVGVILAMALIVAVRPEGMHPRSGGNRR